MSEVSAIAPGAPLWVELLLIGLLAATLLHALRLERALHTLRRDRSALTVLVEGCDASARQAEDGIARLRAVAEEAGREVGRHLEAAASVIGDLDLLTERGEQIADRLDTAVRAGRGTHNDPPPSAEGTERSRSRAERELMHALRLAPAGAG